MLFALKGHILLREKDYVVLNVNNVFYKIYTIRTDTIKEEGETFLFIHEIIRENDRLLYGFENCEDKAIFSKLIEISGVGPKIASNILNNGSNEEIIQAINMENTLFFKKITGVGSALLGNILFALKGFWKSEAITNSALSASFNALRNLGFKEQQIRRSFELSRDSISTNSGEEEIIKLLLSNIRRGTSG